MCSPVEKEETLKRTFMTVAAALIGLTVAVTGFAQVDTTGTAPKTEDRVSASGKRIKTTEPVKRFMGELISIDIAAKTVTAKGRIGGKIEESAFDLSAARIARNLKLEDLKAGDRIAVVYIEKDNKRVAKVVGKPMGRSKRMKAAEETPSPGKPSPAPETKQ
jgi:hypothetical protein